MREGKSRRGGLRKKKPEREREALVKGFLRFLRRDKEKEKKNERWQKYDGSFGRK